MTVFSTEVLRVDSFGDIEVVTLTIDDDDNMMSSGEIGAEYSVDGVSLGADAPAIDRGALSYTDLDGTAISRTFIHFSDGTYDYYFSRATVVADSVASITSFTSTGVVGGINYHHYGVVDEDATARSGSVLVVTSGATASPSSQSLTIWDDDKFFEFDGDGSGGSSETGNPAVAFGLVSEANVDVNTTDAGAGDSTLVLVSLDYKTAGGSGSIEAIKISFNFGPTDYEIYLLKNGGVASFDITEVTGETVLATTVDGLRYKDYGITDDLVDFAGTAGDDYLEGSYTNDKILGDDGADVLLGGMGADLIKGQGGTDTLYGGEDKDELFGGGGKDTLYGGSDRDTLNGEGGNDNLNGGDGKDVLYGGDGKDKLYGGNSNDDAMGDAGNDKLFGKSGADSLNGGDDDDRLFGGGGADELVDGGGSDTLDGGKGSDVFILSADGVTDTITDFTDGTDLIDLDVAFAALTIADVVAGTVKITHSGEDLFVSDDGAGLLTAADFSAADFI
ncbi:MAG: calcium-binding protein [Rhodobacteraceae bacterium]|nr:calcium-binding protein [Paracoccaceae bacterium]